MSFAPEVEQAIGCYVYRLIDPRNGETFYVGRERGNRVFQHARDAQTEVDKFSEKISRINDIKNSGHEVLHVIHRHGMTEEIAVHVEAALIDAYPAATNIMDGEGNSNFGVMSAQQIMTKYAAPIATWQHPCLLITLRTEQENSETLSERIKFAWRVDKNRINNIIYVMAVQRGLIVGVFESKNWRPATAENFPGKETIEGRMGFDPVEAPLDIQNMYLRHRVPEGVYRQGGVQPLRYVEPGPAQGV